MTKVWKMKRTVMVVALALVGFACADGVGQMLEDAGQMLEDAGVSMQDAGDADAATMPDGSTGSGGATDSGGSGGTPGTDVTVHCNKSVVWFDDDFAKRTRYWAEFDVDPGSTEVTVCGLNTLFAAAGSQTTRETCGRNIALWFRSTNTGYWYCGESIDWVNPDMADIPFVPPISITVHR